MRPDQVANLTALFDAAISAFGRVDIALNAKAAFFSLPKAGQKLSARGKLCIIVTSLLGADTSYYSIFAGSKAPVEHFTRAAAKEFGPRGISATAIAPGPMETSFFYRQESTESAADHHAAADLSKFTKTGLTDPEDIKTSLRLPLSVCAAEHLSFVPKPYHEHIRKRPNRKRD